MIARHAGTVLVGQLAAMAFTLTDTLVAGRYASEALASLAVGSSIYISIFVALLGLLQAQLPVWARLRGAGEDLALGRSVRQSLYLAGACALAGMPLLLFPGPLLRFAEVPQHLQAEVRDYLLILALTLPMALLFRLYSTLNQSLGLPRLVTWVQIAALAVKVPLSVWFVFGGLGLPALGLAGCAWASLLVSALMVVLAAWMLRTQDTYSPYRIWAPLERPHWPTLRDFLRLGIPTALSVGVEVTSFTLMALFIARLGTEAVASHQVAGSLGGLLYMVPLALGIATSARVSWWLGRGDEAAARSTLRAGFRLTVGAATLCAGGVALAHQPLARLFAGDNTPLVAIAAGLLPWVALYHLFDAAQTLCVFVLRCYGVATASVVIYSLMLWGVGLGGGYLLAYEGMAGYAPAQAPWAFWAAATVALALAGVALYAVLWRVIRSRRLPR